MRVIQGDIKHWNDRFRSDSASLYWVQGRSQLYHGTGSRSFYSLEDGLQVKSRQCCHLVGVVGGSGDGHGPRTVAGEEERESMSMTSITASVVIHVVSNIVTIMSPYHYYYYYYYYVFHY